MCTGIPRGVLHFNEAVWSWRGNILCVYELGFKDGAWKGGWWMMGDEDGESKQETVRVGEITGQANRALAQLLYSGRKEELGTAMEGSSFHMGRSPTALYSY